MSECESVFFFFFLSDGGCVCGGGSLSNSKRRWNLDDSVGLCPLMIQSFKLLSWRHKRPEEDKKEEGKQKLLFSLFLYRFVIDSIKYLRNSADLEKSGELKTIRAQLLPHKACCDINERKKH